MPTLARGMTARPPVARLLDGVRPLERIRWSAPGEQRPVSSARTGRDAGCGLVLGASACALMA